MGPDQIFQDDDEQLKKRPLIPAIPPPSVAAPSSGPSLSAPKIGPAQSELQRLESTGSGVSQIGNPIVRGIARVGDALGSILAPKIAGVIPGTTAHHNQLVNQQVGLANQEASYGQKQAQGAQEQAQAGHLNAETAALQNPVDKPAVNEVELYQKSPEELEKFYSSREQHQQDKKPAPIHLSTDQGEFLVDPVTHEATPLTFNGQPLKKAAAPGNFEEQNFNEWHQAHPQGTRMQFEAERSRNTQKPEREPKQLAVGPDGTVIELRPGVKVPQGTKSVSGELAGAKPSMDEQRRADLANNMNENLDQLEDILHRRPELFGPIAGRMTGLRGSVGTDDQDVARLKAIEEFMGMAAVGAHAMRNAQHVETAAHAITNGFKNSPQAVSAAVDTARKSLQTFINDANRGQGGSSVAAPQGGGGGMIKVQIPGHPPGQIPAAAREQFLRDNPGAKVIQ
jgi:hypothetical protein